MNAKLTFLLLAALSSGIAMGAEDAIATAQVRKVALFKNGYNWVEMSTTLPDAQRVRITGMPDALLGTVWWDAASGVWQLEGGSVEVESVMESYGYADLLMANAGKQVKIFLKKDRQTEGKLLPTKCGGRRCGKRGLCGGAAAADGEGSGQHRDRTVGEAESGGGAAFRLRVSWHELAAGIQSGTRGGG